MIENEQREALRPLELALFVQRRLAAGESQAEIARRMGKSRQYMTMATALIDAPDWLLDAYRDGRCRGMNELYELRRLHAEHPQYVEAWASDRDGITRERLQYLRAALANSESTVPGVSAAIQANVARRPEPDRAPSARSRGSVVPPSPASEDASFLRGLMAR